MKEWFNHLLDPNGKVSSKRLMGIIGALNLYVHTWINPMTEPELSTHVMLIVGLLGVGAVVDILKKDKGSEK